MSESSPGEGKNWRPGRAVLAGLFVGGIGLAALGIALSYRLGTPQRMGPGFVPVILSSMLVVLGFAIALQREAREGPTSQIVLRPIVFVLGAILCFGLLIRPAGLVPASLIAVPIAAMAQPGRNPLSIAVLAVGITAFISVVFVYGLNVPVDLFW